MKETPCGLCRRVNANLFFWMVEVTEECWCKTCLGHLDFKTLKKLFNFNFCRSSLVRKGFDFPLIIPECDRMSSNPNSSLTLSLTMTVFAQIHCTCWMLLLLLLLDAISCC